MSKYAIVTVAAVVTIAATALPALAQQPLNLTFRSRSLSTLLSGLYGPAGLIVDSEARLPTGETHSSHFNSGFQTRFTQLSSAVASQLASVPLPSPASGFTYELDPELGVVTRSTQSFGPILAERSETIGRGRFSVGFTVQRFTFDTIEGTSLDQVPAVFTHDNAELRGGREDVVMTQNDIEATIHQVTTFLSYGVTDGFDLSLAVPIVDAELRVESRATMLRIGTDDRRTHFFRQSDGSPGEERIFTGFGTANGIGDLTARAKATVHEQETFGVALGLDVRLPTGDDANLLGVGAVGVKPFLAVSGVFGRVSPHVNVAYLWNGSSPLGGNPAEGRSGDLPDQILFVLGADVAMSSSLTAAFDVIGQTIIDAPRLERRTFLALDGVTQLPDIGFTTETRHELSGAIGIKYNVFEDLLIDANLLFAIDDNGLRDEITPLIGLEYSFSGA